MGRFNLDLFDSTVYLYKIYIYPTVEILGLPQYIQSTTTFAIYLLYKSLTISLLFAYPIFFVKTTSFASIIFGLKFILFIVFLIFIRGGIPRYRYDFLTKLGWIKTLSLILIVFFLTLIMTYVN